MPIELTDDLKEYARRQVASGAYADTDALLQVKREVAAERDG